MIAEFTTLSAKVTRELHDYVQRDAEEMGVSISEWLIDAINAYIEEDSDGLTWDDICRMDWDDLVMVIEECELDVNPDDYDYDEHDDLRSAIADELDIEESYEDEEDEED